MANHPISLVSPIQIIQASIARNNETFATPTASTPPPTGVGEHPTASINVPAGTIATDVQTMQSNDATAFLYGSTATNKSVTTSDYTTVDDAAKLANRVATDNDVIGRITREDQHKKKQKQKKSTEEEDSTTEEDHLAEEETSEDQPRVNNSMLVISRGRV